MCMNAARHSLCRRARDDKVAFVLPANHTGELRLHWRLEAPNLQR